MARLRPSDRLPEWEGTTTDGRPIGSASLRGRPVVLVLLRGLG
jgi:peroxiredoxin